MTLSDIPEFLAWSFGLGIAVWLIISPRDYDNR